jgi:hypothetical protein
MDRGHPIKISFMDYDHARPELRRLNHFLLSFLYVCMLCYQFAAAASTQLAA